MRDRHEGKGKRRADDNRTTSPTPLSPSPQQDAKAGDDGVHAGMRSGGRTRSGSRTGRQDALAASAPSTAPSTTDLPATKVHEAQDGLAVSTIARNDNVVAAPRPPPEEGGPAVLATAKQEESRAPARIRRTPWQMMQAHLARGDRAPARSAPAQKHEHAHGQAGAHKEAASGPEPVSTPGSQAQPGGRAPLSREGALRPGVPARGGGDTAPALLLRLSDGVPAPAAAFARGNAPEIGRAHV